MLPQHERWLVNVRSVCVGLFALALLAEAFAQNAGSPQAQKSLDTTSERVRLSEILITTAQPYSPQQLDEARHQAEEVLDAIRTGGSFSELAKTYSHGPTAYTGGDIGYFPRGELASSLDTVVFGMKVGDVSDVIRTKQGFVIIKVTERLAAGVPLDPNWALLNAKLTPELQTYLDKVTVEIRRRWYTRIPDSAKAPLMKHGLCTIHFSIGRDGSLRESTVSSSSGFADLDTAALDAVRDSGRFPRLPDSTKQDPLQVQMNFYYNPEKPARDAFK
jgi:TonB family protein